MRKLWGTIRGSVKKHKIKTAIAAILLLCLVGGGVYATYDRMQTAKDCTSIEKFDFWDNSCYFECDTDAQCAELSKKVDDELNSRFAGSKTIGKTTKTDAKKTDNTTKKDTAVAAKPTGKLFDKNSTGSETNGTVYTVQPDGTLLPKPSPSHVALWNLFSKIVSKEAAVKSVLSFEVYNNGNDSSAASVWRSDDPMKWHMNVNEAYNDNRADLVHTLVHEYGHIVTLSGNQVAVAGSCPRLQLAEGCATPASYIQGFYEAFWKKYGPVSFMPHTHAFHQNEPVDSNSQYPEMPMPNDTTQYEQMPTQQYEGPEQMQDQPPQMPQQPPSEPQGSGNPNEFVTEYASSNIGEDMAESFAYFILRPKPAGSAIKDQKVAYYYKFSELVAMRDRMRAAIGNDVLQRNRMIESHR